MEPVGVTVRRIEIYPIKSLDGIAVDSVEVLAGGALKNDRRFAIFDAKNEILNGKRCPEFHRLRAEFDLAVLAFGFGEEGSADRQRFEWPSQQADAERWLSDFLGQTVRILDKPEGGFPDDLDATGPTVIGQSSLREAASWFAGESLETVRRRFRANIEIEIPEPFWEDRLVGEEGRCVPFLIGQVAFEGVNPCQRCVVPSRHPATGEPTPRFQSEFASRREATLPRWAPRSRFDHFYRFSVNTRGQTTGVIRVGDALSLS